MVSAENFIYCLGVDLFFFMMMDLRSSTSYGLSAVDRMDVFGLVRRSWIGSPQGFSGVVISEWVRLCFDSHGKVTGIVLSNCESR